MRYAVISKGLTLAQVEAELKKAGARDISRAQLIGQLFCELDEAQVRALSLIKGILVKPLKEYRTAQVAAALPSAETLSDVFWHFIILYYHLLHYFR